MWKAQSREIAGVRGLKFSVNRDDRLASFDDVLRGWRDDPGFRTDFNRWLADCPYAAFRFETPGIEEATRSTPFEFVLLDRPSLLRRADPADFSEHFESAMSDVVAFPSLGLDSLLIVPRPNGDSESCGHLAAFVRRAPEAQRHALWQRVAAEMDRKLTERTVWLNTAGAGVPWLHVRLDNRPKYYAHAPYRDGDRSRAS